MGNSLSTDTIPVLVTMVDVHNAKAQDQFYFANVSPLYLIFFVLPAATRLTLSNIKR